MTEEPSGVPFGIQSDLMHHPQCRRIKLTPYSPDEIARMARARLGAEPGTELVDEIHRVSGGNALLVRALIEDRQDAGGATAPLVVGDDFAGSVRTLLNRVNGLSLRLLRVAAVLGPYATPPLLSEMLRIKPSTVESTLGWLTETGLMNAHEFRHRAAREAVLDSMDANTLRELNRRAARLLHIVGMQPGVIADHVLASGPPYEPWALDLVREAACQAIAADDYRLAVRYLRHAVELCGGDDDRAAVTLALTKALWRLNPSSMIAHSRALMQAARDGRLAADDVYWLLTRMLWLGHEDAAEELFGLLEGMECATGPGRADPEDGHAGMRRLSAEHWLAGTHPPLLHRLRGTYRPSALPEGGEQLPNGLHAMTVAALAATLREGETKADLMAAERFLQSVQPGDFDVELVEAALFSLVYSDRITEASSLAEALHRLAERHSSPTLTSVFAAFRAHIAERRGELPEAVEYGRLSLRTLPPRSLGVLAALPLAALIEAHTEMGEYQEAERYLSHPLPESVYRTRYGLHYLGARGRYRVAVGRAHAALDDFLKCGTLMDTWEVDTPLLVPWRLGAAGVSVILHNNARARKFLELHQALPHGHSPRIRGYALMVLAAAEEMGRRPQLLRKAIDMLQDSGHNMELAHALTRLSHSLAALGETDKARLVGRQADTVVRQVHAEPLRQSVESAIETGFGAALLQNGQNLLSPAEYRVASLAALGYTNREIAKRAHITVSTVEQHLTRIYRKLHVNGRNDLSRMFSAKEQESADYAPRGIPGSA
ncbi:helix-turn-helix transcriptional regulator [Nonomuraea antimicrobica]|uniref:helix-turn-helix transcriptional regulator n=1 Tax=Nonomuraea antimicrobica TaxID=561173 RepID=UPI0031EEDD72